MVSTKKNNFRVFQEPLKMTTIKPCVLIILDGWGINHPGPANAVSVARMPFLNKLKSENSETQLLCSGEAVGLPKGIMGNSEVGHLNIGAGRIVYQGLLRIDMAIKDGSFFENEAFVNVMEKVKHNGSALHLMGLVSDAGVHSQLAHLKALLDLAGKKGLSKVFVHGILDGRDTPPDSGVGYVGELQKYLESTQNGRIASICGRYYAMDRDTRWDRTQQAYRLYTLGEGVKETDPVAAVKNAYARGETDEFVKPVVLVDRSGNPIKTVSDQDGIIFFNFRPDRARQITRAFTQPAFDFFKREKTPQLTDFVCMAMYDEKFTLPIAFGPVHLKKILGEVISESGLNQLRIAETEKYAHVTYFFNGGEEKAFPNEDRVLVPSPREVPTYDKKPQMSAYEVADKAAALIESGKYHLVVMNFANLDMVGHTGIMEAAVKACEAVDQCVEKVATAALIKGYAVLVTADHGNAEQMKEANGHVHTAHTLNPVPLVLVGHEDKNVSLQPGVLGDIAPTILDIMGIEKPKEMTGKSLIQSASP
jgi:2,3-bisphosphoglycerate-independent phosphoglycerate mutase